MIVITNQNYIFWEVLDMILPVETKQSKRQLSEDKNLNLIHF